MSGRPFASLGHVFVSAGATADELLRAIAPERAPLALAPSSARGWFGGRTLVACDPIELRTGLSLAEAAEALEVAFTAEEPQLTAVLAAYDGACTLARYAGALVLAEDGWRAWGAAPEIVPAQPAAPLVPDPGAERDPAAPLLRDASWDLEGRDYRAGVEQVRARIAAGDVYVLNLTARLSGSLAVATPAAAFEALQARAGSDMSAYVAGWPGATSWLASVSPERFVRVTTGLGGARLAEIAPIKGTRPRGATPAADAALAAELAADPKERAEHLMVVDLERNDLGRVAVPGSVRVEPLYEVVPTPYCHQLVSSVHATLRPDATFAELLPATFPCGSVTGAPKIAAMRIADELERSPRGAYCGALVVAVPGELDSSVLIRTLEGVADDARTARWGSGCGITHDSDPVAEDLEVLLKASPALGDGAPPVALRETMRVAYGHVPLLDRHLSRLARGGAGPGVLGRVRVAVAEQVAARGADAPYGRLGITVTPDGAVAAGASTEPSSLAVPGGPRIAPVVVESPPQLPPAAAKPASRRYWDRAHNAARLLGADQALLVTPEGTLVDGSTATVWLVLGDALVTPPSPPAVAGVARELVFDLAAARGLRAEERALTLADYEAADAVYLSNAVGGMVVARRV